MRESLRELIGVGEYELAAHRLVYGAVKARLCAVSRPESDGESALSRVVPAGSRERKECPERGRSTK